MPNQQKIDLHQNYPCPSCRGEISPIVLMTEALGCDRCQKIFTLHPDGYTVEQVSNPHPTRNCWQWDGKRWVSMDQSSPISSWTLLAAVMVTMVFAVCSWQALVPSKSSTPTPTSSHSP